MATSSDFFSERSNLYYLQYPADDKQTKRQADSYKTIYFFGFLCHLQHCSRHIATGSWKGRGKQYIKLIKAL